MNTLYVHYRSKVTGRNDFSNNIVKFYDAGHVGLWLLFYYILGH